MRFPSPFIHFVVDFFENLSVQYIVNGYLLIRHIFPEASSKIVHSILTFSSSAQKLSACLLNNEIFSRSLNI